MRHLVLAGALSALIVTGAVGPALAAGAADEADAMWRATTLNLSAYGETKADPDMASISLGVQTTGRTAAQAMGDNARRMSQVTAALRQAGVSAKDIQTSGLNLNAQYDYQQNLPPKLTGYQASNQVTITVYDLGRLGPIIDAVVADGANQVNGISFGLKDPTEAENAARLKAVQALQAKAQLYAGATGMHVGRLVNLSEGGGYVPSPRPVAMYRMAASAAPQTPVEPGQLSVRIDVSALYELQK